MSSDTYSPLPWRTATYNEPGGDHDVLDARDRLVAEVTEWKDGDPNIKIIVTAVNNHDVLVAALRSAAGGYQIIMSLLDKLMPGWRRSYNFHKTRAEMLDLLERVAAGPDESSLPVADNVSPLVEAAKDAMAYIVELGLEGLESSVVQKLDAAIKAAEGGSRAQV